MIHRRIAIIINTLLLPIGLLVSGTGCNTTRHLKDGEYLLRSNKVNLRSDQPITRKGELKDNLESLIVQKPNSRFLGIPYKLWIYNTFYQKSYPDTVALESGIAEKPVIYDSSTIRRSVVNMRGYLYNQGYFYSIVRDTTKFRKKKAYVTYDVETGTNYLIDSISFDITDSVVASFVRQKAGNTVLEQGTEFTYSLLEQERSRIVGLLRNAGYYYFTNQNITFELDTLKGRYKRGDETVAESVIGLVTLQRQVKRPVTDIKIIIRADEDPAAFYRYAISRVRVFPDYIGGSDFRDTAMLQKIVDGVIFRYHDYYVRENVLLKHIFLEPNTYFDQSNYDLTITKLNELGIFQSVRISFRVDTAKGPNWLNANIFLSPGKKYDYSTNLEATTGTGLGGNPAVGSALSVSLRNRNFAKGANLATITANGALEAGYDDSLGNSFFDHFFLLTQRIGVNGSIDFPKFLVPFKVRGMSNRNTPRTEIGLGVSLLDRVSFFRLINTSANLRYKWRETDTKNWEVLPVFVNYISIPYLSESFRQRIENNSFLENTYKPTLIEGENIAFTFSDRERKSGRDYSYVRLAIEEAGGLLKGINSFAKSLDSLSYSQYVKFDFDLQHFFLRRHSVVALRFYGGIGLPYDNSTTLPYIKQYFAGGPYSMRGWRIRTLGPGSYYDTSGTRVSDVIDRTGDIKLELNAEYRFDIVQLFAGALNLEGAVFVDAGNIWLARKTDKYPGGEFKFGNLARDVAINTGVGLRFDIAGFFLVRFDYGMPLKNPGYPDYANHLVESGWVDYVIKPRQWSFDNLRFGINYPF